MVFRQNNALIAASFGVRIKVRAQSLETGNTFFVEKNYSKSMKALRVVL